MSPLEYFQWYYLIYLVPGGTALLTLMLSLMGGGMRHHRVGHSGGHHHGGLRHGSHVRASTSQARHGGPRHSAAARQGAKGKNEVVHVPATIGDQMLGLVGFGRIPSPFVWGSLLLGWSVFGFWATRLLEPSMRHPALFVLPAMAIAAGGALSMARLTSSLLGRLLPHDESFDVSTIELVGMTGSVTYPVDQARGRVHIYDEHGTMHDCQAKVVPGGIAVGRGAKVLVIDYDSEHDQLIVEETN